MLTFLPIWNLGEKNNSNDYKPFGQEANATGTEKYAFTGQYNEADIGLYYFGARWYDASLGRFISEDPIKGSMTSSQSQNPYVYCVNNPLRYVDPSGMRKFLRYTDPNGETRHAAITTNARGQTGFQASGGFALFGVDPGNGTNLSYNSDTNEYSLEYSGRIYNSTSECTFDLKLTISNNNGNYNFHVHGNISPVAGRSLPSNAMPSDLSSFHSILIGLHVIDKYGTFDPYTPITDITPLTKFPEPKGIHLEHRISSSGAFASFDTDFSLPFINVHHSHYYVSINVSATTTWLSYGNASNGSGVGNGRGIFFPSWNFYHVEGGGTINITNDLSGIN